MTDDFRLQELERDVANLVPLQGRVMVLETQIANEDREIGELKTMLKDGFAEAKEDQKATRRVTMGFAFTIAGSCVVTLLTLLMTGVIS